VRNHFLRFRKKLRAEADNFSSFLFLQKNPFLQPVFSGAPGIEPGMARFEALQLFLCYPYPV